jgi:hypothetical protein
MKFHHRKIEARKTAMTPRLIPPATSTGPRTGRAKAGRSFTRADAAVIITGRCCWCFVVSRCRAREPQIKVPMNDVMVAMPGANPKRSKNASRGQ